MKKIAPLLFIIVIIITCFKSDDQPTILIGRFTTFFVLEANTYDGQLCSNQNTAKIICDSHNQLKQSTNCKDHFWE